MKEKPPNPYRYQGGFRESLRGIASMIFTSEKSIRREIEAKKRWDEYIQQRVEGLERYFNNFAYMQKGLTEILEKHGVGEHERSFRWRGYVEDPVIAITFKDPEPMRNILNSTELRPEEIAIAHTGLDKGGAWGSIRFIAGEIDGNKVEMTYLNYVTGGEGIGNGGDGGYVLDNHGDNLERWGYTFKEKEWTAPFPNIWELKTSKR